MLCRTPWPAQLISPVQAAAAHPAFIMDTTFSSPTNITTVQYVNGSTVLVYSSAPTATSRFKMTERLHAASRISQHGTAAKRVEDGSEAKRHSVADCQRVLLSSRPLCILVCPSFTDIRLESLHVLHL